MSRTTLKASSLAVAIIFTLPAVAGQLEDGFAALQQKDFEKTRSLLLPPAKSGNVAAQFNLGPDTWAGTLLCAAGRPS